MTQKKHTVDLAEDDRAELESFVSSGVHRTQDVTRARILLKADEGATDEEICNALGCGESTPYRARKRYADRGIAAVHRRKPDRDYERKLDGDDEARLIALVNSEPPDGRARWTLRLLADRLVTLDEIGHESISHQTVHEVLKKNELQPHRSKQWVIPPEQDTDFIYHMEDVLSLYREPYDPERPVVCFDEHPKQLLKQVEQPCPAEPGAVAREDYQYECNGTKNLFLASEPLAGWRTVRIKDRRTTEDWVYFIQHLVDQHYPDADCIRVVLDNLNTHNPAAFYEFFEPTEARRILDKLEFHFTPVHGRWLCRPSTYYRSGQHALSASGTISRSDFA